MGFKSHYYRIVIIIRTITIKEAIEKRIDETKYKTNTKNVAKRLRPITTS